MRRFAAIGSALALAGLLAATPAAGEDLEGNAVIDDVRVVESVVVLDGQPYRVDDLTRLRDAMGAELTLGTLPSIAGEASPDDAAVWFSAVPSGDGTHRLRELELTGAIPR
jgi:hypothetical protein